jgi:hypothetical protein
MNLVLRNSVPSDSSVVELSILRILIASRVTMDYRYTGYRIKRLRTHVLGTRYSVYCTNWGMQHIYGVRSTEYIHAGHGTSKQASTARLLPGREFQKTGSKEIRSSEWASKRLGDDCAHTLMTGADRRMRVPSSISSELYRGWVGNLPNASHWPIC